MLEQDVIKTSVKFDVVIGNPPYQNSQDENAGSNNLWQKFVKLGMTYLVPNGYIAFITPTSWMSPSNNLLSTFKKNNLIWVSTQIKQHFNVGSTFSVWILQKGINIGDTIFNDNAYDLSQVLYVIDNPIAMSIHHKVVFNTKQKIDYHNNTTAAHSSLVKKKPHLLSKICDASHQYPVHHTNAQTLYSSHPTPTAGILKVMFTLSGYFRPVYDGGVKGTSEIVPYIPVQSEEEGNQVLRVLCSKLYRFVVLTGKWSGFLNPYVIRNLPVVDFTKMWTDQELYQHFNLTQDEIDLIEATIK